MSTLFDYEPPAPAQLHACAGTECGVCASSTTAKQAADRATLTVSSDREWANRAEEWLELQALGTRFTADDLVADEGKPMGSANQIGATLRTWARRGHIQAVGFYEATRKESHGRVIRVWEVVE